MNNIDLSWHDIVFLNGCKYRVTYIKLIANTRGLDVRRMAEVGVFRGDASMAFSILFPEAKLHLIDPWLAYDEYLTDEAGPMSDHQIDYDNAYQHVQETFGGDPNISIHKMTSFDAAQTIDEEFDLVFIDGNHSYESVKEDIALWSKKVKPGGLITGHDYDHVNFPGVVQAVDEAFGDEVLLGHDYTWIYGKPSSSK
ncbi:MAG: hypothetical protein SP1CHLAM54_03400 [Chlamydiia bacterium]|nr:hypothetical protein [Chlamydiia bacterium]MCH9615256.1 hypothetical protein [Chlamydiia bacterium]MCH9628422.1 hypothetical protein [Chlamydiia bacterium]